MLSTLRTLLVAAVAVATVLVGLRDAFADAGTADVVIRSIDADALDGSREDDSGTRSEQVEEDDRDEQDDREVDLFATSALACDLGSVITSLPPTARTAVVNLRGRSALVRGPPTRG